MVSAEFEGTCTMMQSAAAGDPLSPESSYLRGMASAGYPHPEPGASLAHPHHPHMQVYDEDSDEKRSANMNMGPRTWYQVPRDLRYPEDPHLQYSLPPMSQPGMKRNAEGAGLDMMDAPESSDEDSTDQKPLIPGHLGEHEDYPPGAGRGKPNLPATPVNGKKTKGRVKIKMEFIDNKLRRYTTFSKRKTGIMKKSMEILEMLSPAMLGLGSSRQKTSQSHNINQLHLQAYELSTLTGTQVMLLVASETGHVYTFATRKLQPMITSDAGKALIQVSLNQEPPEGSSTYDTCLNSPDPPQVPSTNVDQRMSATGYEETELTYNVNEEEQQKVRQMMYSSHYSSHAQHSSHNLFSPSASAYPSVSHSPYITPHPAPSPSPSHHHPYGVSLSPTLSHSPTHHLSSPGPPYSGHHPSR